MTLKTVICWFSILSMCFAQEKCSSENEFLCKTGGCISKQFLCDGSKECFDGSDETHDLCQYRSCSQSMDYGDQAIDDIFAINSLGTGQNFRCGYGACISPLFICDGIKHCITDGSDETKELCQHYNCGPRQFRCNYGGCISRQNACDNRYQCFDRSDETPEACRWRKRFCPRRNRFQCSYGACIRKKRKCDAVIDCLDGSDESEKTCHRRSNLPALNTSIPFSNPISTYFFLGNPPPTIRPIANFSKVNLPPSDRLLSDPLLSDPLLSDPLLSDPLLSDPLLSDPLPSDPLPSDPLPSDPLPSDPLPSDPPSFDPPPFSLPVAVNLSPSNPLPSNSPVITEDNGKGCEQTDDEEVALEILACGDNRFGYCSDRIIPAGTVMVIYCNENATPLKCEEDNLWHFIKEPSKTPRKKPCQDATNVSNIVQTTTTTSTSTPVPTGNDKGCQQTDNEKVAFEIIACGDDSDCSDETVPVDTAMVIYCDETSTLLTCEEDNLWHFVIEPSKTPRKKPCQDATNINNIVQTITTTSTSTPVPTGNDKGCQQTDNEKVAFEIIACGDDSDCSDETVPVDTAMVIYCDETSTLLTCEEDNLWHFVIEPSKTPRKTPCQDVTNVNSPVQTPPITRIPTLVQPEMCASRNEFLCKSGGCIKKEFLCDGSKECPDGSDETNDLCQYRSCSQSIDYVESDTNDIFAIPSLGTGQSFRCGYGACISSRFICDGIKNCVADGSDETKELCESRTCQPKQFRCNYGGCISRQNVCDNRYHCYDKSDETPEACQWRRKSCSRKAKFQCTYGSCIRKKQKCDAVIDCLDGSDESEETCGHRPNLHIVNTPTSSGDPAITRIPPTEPPPAPVNPPSSNGKGCKQTDNEEVALEILTCGDDSGCIGQIVGVGTVMVIYCDQNPFPLKCEDDNLWHFIREPAKTPRKKPCQDAANPNNPIEAPTITRSPTPVPTDCGILPPLSSVPWLVGLFREGEFSCTGTLIGPSLVLTAGHCIVRHQASNNKRTINPGDLKIQFKSAQPNDPKNFASVSLIEIHPHYSGGHSPRFDMALVILKENMQDTHGLSSACIDDEGKLLTVPAWTFNRTVGQRLYSWKNFQQTLDTTCFNKATTCTRHLNIGDNQFCSINEDVPMYLHQGASGGPYLISKTKNGQHRWTVAGVVSSSIQTTGCGTRTVFASTNKLFQWIINCGFKANCKV